MSANMKVSRIEAFQCNAQFARAVAELVRSPAGRAHWLSIAEFWTWHSDADSYPKEVKKAVGASTSDQPSNE